MYLLVYTYLFTLYIIYYHIYVYIKQNMNIYICRKKKIGFSDGINIYFLLFFGVV